MIGMVADHCARFAIDGLLDRGFSVSVTGGLTRGIGRQIEAVVVDFAGGAVT